MTRRAALVDGFRTAWGEERIEYWNAGVEGYGTHQVDRYHARFLQPLDADLVVYTMHPNDFSATPVTFLEGDRLVVHATRVASTRTNPWLFRNSELYRLWLSWRLDAPEAGDRIPTAGLLDEAESALVALRERVESGGARFVVLLLPWLAPEDRWPEHARFARERSLAMLDAHAIEAVDLLPALRAALAASEEVRERPKDAEHPSKAFGLRAAALAVERGLTAD